MGIFDKLLEKLSSVENGETDLLDFYALFWENTLLLNRSQCDEILSRLKIINTSAQSGCWYRLSEILCNNFFSVVEIKYETFTGVIDSFREIGDKNGEGAAQALMVIYFKNIGALDKAQEFVQKAILNIGDDKAYTYFRCFTYYQAGEMHHLLKDYKAAIGFFNTGLGHSNNGASINARLLNGLATVYRDTNELDLAFEHFQKSLKEIEGLNNYVLESKNYTDIGNYYFKRGDFDQSLFFQEKSLVIRQERQMNKALITNYIELAEIYLKQNKLPEALKNALHAEKFARELNVVIKLYQANHILSSIYEAMGEASLSLEYFKKYHQAKDELLSQEGARKIKQISLHYEMETMQQEKEIFKLRNVVLKEALDEIEASVRYALRIQKAILPPVDLIKEKLPDSFVLYKPKDVVAGDFYWMEEMDNTVFIAAADCTGHGVPGAMVSVVCSNALNRAVKEFHLYETGKILDKVTDLVLETFEKSVDEVKDGMDISLLSVNMKSGQVQWSGAYNPLWYFESGTLKEIVADKQPIGYWEHRKDFTTHSITYKPGTTFYLFTDGYADQFGGPLGKKFKYKQLQEILSASVEKDPSEQRLALDTAFENWKGNLEQIDDVCIVGVRL